MSRQSYLMGQIASLEKQAGIASVAKKGYGLAKRTAKSVGKEVGNAHSVMTDTVAATGDAIGRGAKKGYDATKKSVKSTYDIAKPKTKTDAAVYGAAGGIGAGRVIQTQYDKGKK